MMARREECKRRTGNGNGFGLTLWQQLAVWGLDPAPGLLEVLMGFPVGWTDPG
jgi:hypothetical protein